MPLSRYASLSAISFYLHRLYLHQTTIPLPTTYPLTLVPYIPSAHTDTHVCTHARAHTHTHTHTHARARARTHACIARTHAHTHTHSYICLSVSLSRPLSLSLHPSLFTCPPSRFFNCRSYQLSLHRAWIDMKIIQNRYSLLWCLSEEQHTSDKQQVNGLLYSFQPNETDTEYKIIIKLKKKKSGVFFLSFLRC